MPLLRTRGLDNVPRRGVVGRVTAFQLGGPKSILRDVGDLNLYPRTGCVSFVFCPVLSVAVALTFC